MIKGSPSIESGDYENRVPREMAFMDEHHWVFNSFRLPSKIITALTVGRKVNVI